LKHCPQTSWRRASGSCRRGLNYVRAYPGEAVRGAARKVAAGFDWRLNPPRSPSVEAVYGLSYVPIAIIGVWGMIMTRALARTRYNLPSVCVR
jgi:hypothetical protein